jgi:hypothetical protein
MSFVNILSTPVNAPLTVAPSWNFDVRARHPHRLIFSRPLAVHLFAATLSIPLHAKHTHMFLHCMIALCQTYLVIALEYAPICVGTILCYSVKLLSWLMLHLDVKELQLVVVYTPTYTLVHVPPSTHVCVCICVFKSYSLPHCHSGL